RVAERSIAIIAANRTVAVVKRRNVRRGSLISALPTRGKRQVFEAYSTMHARKSGPREGTQCAGGRNELPRARLEHVGDPVPHRGDADRDVVDLAVVEAAFVTVEDAQHLLSGAHGVEQRVRESKRNLLVTLAVQEQERAAHLLHD